MGDTRGEGRNDLIVLNIWWNLNILRAPASSRGGAMAVRMMPRRINPTRSPRK